MRLHTYPELAALFGSEGLEPEPDWGGGLRRLRLTRESWRLILPARKPAA